MLEVNVRDEDKGYEAIKRNFFRMGNYHIQAGVLLPEAAMPKEQRPEISLVDVARIHEFGAVVKTPNKEFVVPERSFIRSTFDENRKKLINKMRRAARRIIRDKLKPEEEYGKVADWLAKMIKKKIRDGIPPPLKADTVARKSRNKAIKNPSTPLIETKQLIDSIRGRVVRR